MIEVNKCPKCGGYHFRRLGKTKQGSQRYVCQNCGRHCNENTIDIELVTCPNCSTDEIIKDGTSPAGNQKYKCTKCNKRFSKPIKVRVEINKKCPRCGSTHVIRSGTDILVDGTTNQKYQCMDCNRYFSDNSAERGPVEGQTCPRCGSVNIGRSGHQTGIQRYYCKDCKKKFQEKLLGQHKAYREETCPYCGSHKMVLKGKSVNGEQRYLCRDCNRYTTGLKRNDRIAVDIVCPKCGEKNCVGHGVQKGEQSVLCQSCGHCFKIGVGLSEDIKKQIWESFSTDITVEQCMHQYNITKKVILNLLDTNLTADKKKVIILYGYQLRMDLQQVSGYVKINKNFIELYIPHRVKQIQEEQKCQKQKIVEQKPQSKRRTTKKLQKV